MTTNDKLIERLAQKAWHDTAEVIPQCERHIHAAKAFLAAYLAEREKDVCTLPTEEQREEILNTARRSFRHAQSSCRGQQVTESDDPDTHVIWATWDMCAKLFLAPQLAIPEGMALVPKSVADLVISGDLGPILMRDGEHAAPCPRCAELERSPTMVAVKDAIESARMRENVELQDKIAEQAEQIAMYRSEMSAAVKAGFCSAQDLYTSYLGQAERIEALEALSVTNILIDVVPGDGSGLEVYAKSVQDVESELTRLSELAQEWDMAQPRLNMLEEEKAKADAVIESAGIALQEVQDLIHESRGIYGMHLNGDESPWNELEQGGRFERLCTLPDALTAIEQYQKGE